MQSYRPRRRWWCLHLFQATHPSLPLHRAVRSITVPSLAQQFNAIAGDLIEVLGVDLVATTCVCASCGASGFFAEAVVYMRGPGRVARCRACSEMLAVLVTIRGITCVDLRGIAARSDR